MVHSLEITLPPEKVSDRDALYRTAARAAKTSLESVNAVIVERRSIDARSKNPVYRLKVQVYIGENPAEQSSSFSFKQANRGKRIAIIGSGPAGLFAALTLLEHGITPVVFERGKNVRERRRDLRAIQQFHTVNPDSNYCFGEGGAGTYSDGKLYTRSTKRGDIKRILSLLVHHGAHPDILIDAHPHIGSNKLPKVIEAMRNTILQYGGEIHFDSRLTDIYNKNGALAGVVINDTTEYPFEHLILATGHSARDIYYLMEKRGIAMTCKPFALGVRVEHPQQFINKRMYHSEKAMSSLPAASYSLTCTIGGKGTFSFCMCPGGIIVPSATMPDEIVVNGMSMSRRDSLYANSGFVTTVDESDFREAGFSGVFAGLHFQQMIEHAAYRISRSQKAPAQRLTEFLAGNAPGSVPKSSYIPGLHPAAVHELFPEAVYHRLKEGFHQAGKKIPGFISDEAVVCAPESRTSSPVTIIRDSVNLESPSLKGLYPVGEGAGYAGGIVSAAMDGERAARVIAQKINTFKV